MNNLFVFIGPSKTASTWIYKSLYEHPEISLPTTKDIYFFDKHYDQGLSWYESFFNEVDSEKITGEFSHDYILSREALKRLKQYRPDCKIMICLRNPYERTESGVRFLQRNGYGFDELSSLIKKHSELVEGSLYGKNVQRVYDIFNKDQVILLDYGELQKNPQSFLDEIFQFLGVYSFTPSNLEKKINQAAVARNAKLAYIVKFIAITIRKLGGARLVSSVKMSPLVTSLLYSKKKESFVLSNADKKYLAQYFEPDISQLESILGRSYKEWRNE